MSRYRSGLKKIIFLFVCTVLVSSCTGSESSFQNTKKMLVLGFDGMDPVMLEKYMAEGVMPNFKALGEKGDFKSLATSMPPQSPVAWANLITGMNPGGHGIFDFIARDPLTYSPYLSTSKTADAKTTLSVGEWVFPISEAETTLMRRGKAFWKILEEHGIPATVLHVPANFPPEESKAKTISGMGTPDIKGTYGTFSFYTTRDLRNKIDTEDGTVFHVEMKNNIIKTELPGSPNTFKRGKPVSTVPLIIKVDPENPVALIQVQDKEILLKEGEWSDWINVEFKLIPFQNVNGICRFHLSKVHPYFELYVTPVNIDPLKPVLPVSTPPEYSSELAKELGYFFTLGMPEDTKALDKGFIDEDVFLEQADSILQERLKILNLELKKFNSGVLFVYFSTTDPVQHMFWRYIDKKHPLYNEQEALRYSDVIRQSYMKMDEILGDVIKKLDNKTTVIALSDHGFGSFRRYFHLNTWLKENGYLFLKDKNRNESDEFFENVDFQRTKAYALGFNALYINLKGREGKGIIAPAEREQLIREITGKLEQIKDPLTGQIAINKAYRREEIYSGKHVEDAPDLLIGYNNGYCASWETSLGKVPKGLFGDNRMKWSGNHLWDYKLVPGIILSNRKIRMDDPALYDIAPSILAEFGIKPDKEMSGKQIF